MRTPMSWDEFELMPWRLGWKHEYWDGCAHLTPRRDVVCVTIDVTPRSVNARRMLRQVRIEDRRALTSPFVDAFADSIEYYDWPRDKIREAAIESIHGFFAGTRGSPHRASCLAVARSRMTGDEVVIGAALIVETGAPAAALDILFVTPTARRRGLATNLVAAAMNELDRSGVKRLESAYILGNEESRAWHQAFGFVEEPDLRLAQLYWRHAEHELHRHAVLHHLSGAEFIMLQRESVRWKQEVERLELLAEQDRDAVFPLLRRMDRGRGQPDGTVEDDHRRRDQRGGSR